MKVSNMGKEKSKTNTAVAPASGSTASSFSKYSEVIGALANLAVITDDPLIREYITRPYDIKTPPEKVKKRPDGWDYVESSYMDYQAKQFMPLYQHTLLHISIDHGWVNIIVSLKDRTTGNVELGADSARIQVKQGTEDPNFRDIIDFGNNLKSALSKAIKNAQSRFGVSADVYRRRESIPSNEERKRHDDMENQISKISPSRAQMFKEQWAGLGTDWSEFLDKWQVYIDRNSKQA